MKEGRKITRISNIGATLTPVGGGGSFARAVTLTVASSTSKDKKNADYVATGTNDDVTIQNALNALPTSGGRVVLLEGTYNVGSSISINTGQWLVGQGYESTIIKLSNTINTSVILTKNFATLTGTNTVAAPYNFGITDLTIDGNKTNNLTGSYVLGIYGYGYTLNNLRIRNGKSWGLWSEWATQSSSPGNDSMEAFVTNFKIHENDGGGLYLKGPHDTQFENGIILLNGTGAGSYAVNIPVDQYANGSTFSDVHIWGGTYDYAIYNLSTGISFNNCQVEGSLIAEIYNGANSNNYNNLKIFAGGVNKNTVKGIYFANSANNAFIRAKMEDMGGGILDLTNAGGDNNIEIFATYISGGTVPSPAVIGTIDANSYVNVHMLNAAGVSTSDSILAIPETIKNDNLTITANTANTNETLKVQASGTGSRAALQLTGFNASNSGDYGLLTMRTDLADMIFSCFDADSSDFHQMFDFDYENDRVNFGVQTLWDQKGTYNTPTEQIIGNFMHNDDSNNASPSTLSMMLRFNSGSYTENAGKMAKISAIRPLGDFAATVDLAFFTSPTNSTTIERLRILANGNTGIGTSSPTAVLQLKAGTATANTSPLKFTSGTNLTSAESGAVEYNGTNYFVTDSVPTRHTVTTNDQTQTLTNKTLTSPIINGVISPSSDSTTAIQFDKADGTTNIINIDTSNSKVGIGTTSPAEILHISKTTGNFTTIRFDSGTTQGYFFSYDGDNTVQIGSNTNSAVSLRVNNSNRLTVNTSGNIDLVGHVTKYDNIATVAKGVPSIYGTGRSTAQTAAVTSVATYTVGGSDSSFIISANANVTTFVAGTFNVTVAYTDETNTSRTLTLNFSSITGTLGIAIAAAGPFEGIPAHIRCKASTAITIATSGTFTSLTYNVEGYITQIG